MSGPAIADAQCAAPRERLRSDCWRMRTVAVPFDAAGDVAAWLRGQPQLTVGVALTDPRPRRGELLGIAAVDAAGRVVTAGAEDAPRFADLILSAGRPLVGHEVKQLLVWELARRDPRRTATSLANRATCPRSRMDTQIAAYVLNAALRSQRLVRHLLRAARA